MTGKETNIPKSVLRKHYLEKRQAFSNEEFDQLNVKILEKLKNDLDLSALEFIHVFLPIKKFREINTLPIIDYLKSVGKQIVLSKSSLTSNDMQHFLYDEHTSLVENKWGILEPTSGHSISEENLNLVFVPLLCYDKKGNRIGYGKGYYDNFLSKCSEDCLKVGLSLFPPVDFISDMEPMDVPLNCCISPSGFYSF